MENYIFHELMRKNEVRWFARENLGLSDIPNDHGDQENFSEDLKRIKAEFYRAEQNAYQNIYYQLPPATSCIGKAKRFAKRVIRKLYSKLLGWLVFPFYDRQTIFNKSLLNGTNLLSNYTVHEEEQFIKRIEQLESKYELLSQENKAFSKTLDLLKADQQHMAATYESENEQNQGLLQIDERLQQLQEIVNLQFSNMDQRISHLTECTAGLSPGLLNYITDTLNITYDINLVNDGEINYFDFENHFRGPRTLIKERFAAYIPYFHVTSTEMVVDLGCGRGEFIEIMYENGVHVKGVDNYQPFIDYCTERGFDVEQADALTWLNSCPDNSLSGIFMGQVIEHVSSDYAIALIKCAYRKLKVNCYFVLETPNSQSLSTYCNFYIDVGHAKPIHFATLEYIFKMTGYQNVERFNSELTLSPNRLSLLADTLPGSDTINKDFTVLNDILFGYEDYTLIAKK